tara:strand:- start:201 stop:458 length:258 start_codon:yes stop_codon:yes gene_type:complete
MENENDENRVFIPITWEDSEIDEDGKFVRTLYWMNDDGTPMKNGWIDSIEMEIDDGTVMIDFEEMSSDPREFINLLFDQIKNFYD